jgi:tungstate transport system permease protein
VSDAIAKAWALLVALDPDLYHAVWMSLGVSLTACTLAAVLGVPVGVAVATRRFRGRGAVQLILNTAMALPTVVIGLVVYMLLSRRGLLGGLDLLYEPAGIALAEFLLALPIVANLTVAAIRGLDPRLALTCQSLGASSRQQAWMLVREGRFAVTAALVTAFGRVVGEVGIAMMIGGNIKGSTRTMTTSIALETSMGEFELALAMGLVLLLVALVVNAILYGLQRE